jgi:hypothetical protein
MATKYQINHYLDTPLGRIHFYADPIQQKKAEKLIKDTPHILFDAYEDAAMRFGKEIIKRARQCIDSGLPPRGAYWPPLSPKYIAAMGGDDRFYLKTVQYYESIGIHRENVYFQNGTFAKTRIFIGLPKGVMKIPPRYSRKHLLSLIQVANILENGSPRRNIPPRPLWKPLYQDLKGNERIKTFVIKAIQRQLKKYM